MSKIGDKPITDNISSNVSKHYCLSIIIYNGNESENRKQNELENIEIEFAENTINYCQNFQFKNGKQIIADIESYETENDNPDDILKQL